MTEGNETFEGKKVKIFLKGDNKIVYTLDVSRHTDKFIRGVDKFGEDVMLSLDTIRSVSTLSGTQMEH